MKRSVSYSVLVRLLIFSGIGLVLVGLQHRGDNALTVITINQVDANTSQQSQDNAALQPLIDEAILFEEGLRLGLAESDPIVFNRLHQNMVFLQYGDDFEAMYQQAMAMGMLRKDIVIRRRVIQLTKQWIRNQFPLESEHNLSPTDQQLQRYIQQHAHEFRTPVRYSFEQLFIDPRGLNEKALSQRFTTVRQRLAQSNENKTPALNEGLADPTLLPLRFRLATRQTIQQRLGPTFLQQLDTGADSRNRWQGPVQSSYGFHFVRIEAIREARLPPLENVYNRAYLGWQQQNKAQLLQHYLANARQHYDIIIEEG